MVTRASNVSLEGIAELPLHSGKVSPWLIKYMRKLGRAIIMYIIEEFGPDELVRRCADPFWFQAFNNVIGMDWDSSGSTTVVLYVFKSIAPPQNFRDLGLAVLGGKGTDARALPREIQLLGDSIDVNMLEKSSRLSAKIDSTALQDGYELYIHGMLVSENGTWTVIQQGMNLELKMARRYHLHGSKQIPAVDRDPHTGVACNHKDRVLNLVDEPSRQTQKTILDLIVDTSPRRLIEMIASINRSLRRVQSLERWFRSPIPNSQLHEMRINDRVLLNPRFYRPVTNIHLIERIVRRLYELKPSTFGELLLIEGLGPEALRALALVADVIYGYTPSFRDPVTHPIDPFMYAYAHGGKDEIPFPVNIQTMRRTIEFLESAIENSGLDAKLRRQALKRLSQYVRKTLSSTQHTIQ